MSQPTPADPAAFTYVRTVISIIVGLGVGRLLTGLARFVQHPQQQPIFVAHLSWVFFMLVYVIHFWWWEFRLGNLQWTFPIYVFVILYASLIFFLCTLLFPDTMAEYKGFTDYFISRRHWFFGILIAIFLLDIVDSLIKGPDYLPSLGIAYWLRMAFYVAGCIVGMAKRNAAFQSAFAVAALLCEIGWASAFYNSLT